ncbi:MAG: hypothetical protein ACRDD2_11325 [Sarcina sp.]
MKKKFYICIFVFVTFLFCFSLTSKKDFINISKKNNLEILKIKRSNDINTIKKISSPVTFSDTLTDNIQNKEADYKIWTNKNNRELNLYLYLLDEKILIWNTHENSYRYLTEDAYEDMLSILGRYNI